MEHQTLRSSHSEELLDNMEHRAAADKDLLQQFYYTMPNGSSSPGLVGVRLAPLAKFDEKDFDLPLPLEAKHKVKLFKALQIFFSLVIMVRFSSHISQ